jgi:hypothetical protein
LSDAQFDWASDKRAELGDFVVLVVVPFALSAAFATDLTSSFLARQAKSRLLARRDGTVKTGTARAVAIAAHGVFLRRSVSVSEG